MCKREMNCTSVIQEGILSLKLENKQETLLILQWRCFKIEMEIKTYSDPFLTAF